MRIFYPSRRRAAQDNGRKKDSLFADLRESHSQQRNFLLYLEVTQLDLQLVDFVQRKICMAEIQLATIIELQISTAYLMCNSFQLARQTVNCLKTHELT